MGFTDFVSPEDGFRTLSGDPWPDSKSSGVYSWVAENGEADVGQAVSVRRRLLDHWKVHRDILAAAFMRLDRQKLDEFERTCIKDISKNFSTRNIKHAISTSAFVPFDTFMTGAERQVFLLGSFASKEHVWRDLGVLEQKQATKFRRLEREGRFGEIVDALRVFISNCIPNPASTENRFWSVTLYPQQGTLLRVNSGQQEVFTVFDADGDGHLVARPLASRWLNVKEFLEGPHYKTQSFAYFVDLSDFADWFTDERRAAMRELVIWLMRHTAPLNNGSHCPQIVRAAFG
jgi:hypothetical protein